MTADGKLSGITVLVVEDDADCADVVARLLRIEGAQVLTASNPDDAITSLRSCPADIVVCDLALSGGDGYGFLRMLREEKSEQVVPLAGHVVALTGYAADADRERALKAGFELFLIKPIRGEELIRAIAMTAAGQAASFAALRQRSTPPTAQ
jgi:CheY-like chemotaxis protein